MTEAGCPYLPGAARIQALVSVPVLAPREEIRGFSVRETSGPSVVPGASGAAEVGAEGLHELHTE